MVVKEDSASKRLINAQTVRDLTDFLNHLPSDGDIYVGEYGLVCIRRNLGGCDLISLRSSPVEIDKKEWNYGEDFEESKS